MTDLAEIRRRIADVDGWLSDEQVAALHHAAAGTEPGQQIVEIGSFRGRSTIVLASSAPDGVRVVAIDPHAGNDRGPQEFEGFAAEAASDHERFLANLDAAGVRDRVTYVRQFSHAALDAVRGPVQVLFVDGAHRFRPARDDIRRWGARVPAGGDLLIHDCFSSIGVTLAVLTDLALGKRFRYVGRARSLAIYRADLAPGWRPRVTNALHHLRELPWFLRNVGLKVLLSVGLGRVLRRRGRPVPEWPY